MQDDIMVGQSSSTCQSNRRFHKIRASLRQSLFSTQRVHTYTHDMLDGTAALRLHEHNGSPNPSSSLPRLRKQVNPSENAQQKAATAQGLAAKQTQKCTQRLPRQHELRRTGCRR